MAAAPSLTIHLFSFGFKYSGPPEDSNGGGFVFDCRCLPNPYWDQTLRPHTGLEPPVVEFMERHPEVAEFAQGAAGMVLQAARAYAERDYSSLMVAFGCTGGRHRSVYQAERLRSTLEQAGFRVETRHVDIESSPEGAE